MYVGHNKYLNNILYITQGADGYLYGVSQNETFFEEVRELREIAKDLPYDFWVTLVGDTITEEALPTYESWLMEVEGVNQDGVGNGWSKWIRQWTGRRGFRW